MIAQSAEQNFAQSRKMLRNFLSKSSLDFLGSNSFNISCNPVCVQSVRWRRKPRWMPIAKTKIFKIRERYVLPDGEAEEWLRLNNNYKTQMRSVRAFFREEVANKKLQRAAEMTPADEEAEFQRCLEINEQWNAEIAIVRNTRVAEDDAKRHALIEKSLENKVLAEERFLAKIDEQIKREIENAPSFITRDNLDQAIEAALANPIDYNFSIDLQGNIYRGNERPEPVIKKTRPIS